MDTIIQPSFTVGAQQGPFSAGTITNAALGPHAESLLSQLEARYRIGVRNGEVYFACNQATQAVSVALTTTYTGCVVYNPVTSKKNLSILAASFSAWSAPAGIVSIGLQGGWSAAGVVTHTAALVVYNAKTFTVGGGYGGADSQATTVGTPIWLTMLSSANTSAALSTANSPVWFDIGGAYEVPPGGWIAIGAQTAISGVGSIQWREVDA